MEMRWQIGKLIGQGSHGQVYMGMNVQTREVIAIKSMVCFDTVMMMSVSHKAAGRIGESREAKDGPCGDKERVGHRTRLGVCASCQVLRR